MKISCSLLFVLALMLAPAARATTVIPPDFSTMVKRAEFIFRGEVVSTRSAWEGDGSTRHIETYVTFNVLKVLKGRADSTYVLQMLGGVVGDRAMKVSGVPDFKVGEKTILFVEHNGKQFFPVVGIMHGYFKVVTDANGQETIVKANGRPLYSTADIDKAHAKAVASSGVAAEEQFDPLVTTWPAAIKRNDFETAIASKVATP